MNYQIEVSGDTYERLGKLVIGFDSPENVINRLLDMAEGKPEKKPELQFTPANEDEFKAQLLETKQAELTIYKSDGSRELVYWSAHRFTPDSNLRSNLWSGYLRGWQNKGIVKAELAVLPRGDDERLIKNIAGAIGVKYSELEAVYDHCEVTPNESDDGHLYGYILEFSEECPQEFLDKVDGLEDRTMYLDPSLYDDESEAC